MNRAMARGILSAGLAVVAYAAGLPGPAAAADAPPEPLVKPGARAEVSCETQATQVAPEAKISAGLLRIRLDLSAATEASASGPGAPGSWIPLQHAPSHLASIAARHRDACQGGCPIYVGAGGTVLELWVPRRTTLDKTAPGETLTIAVIDLTTLKIKASTFLDQQIASLEQGSCSRLP